MRVFFVTCIISFITISNISSQFSIRCGIDGSITANQYSFTHIPIKELESPIQYGFGLRLGSLLSEKYYIRTGILRTNMDLNIIYDWYIPNQPVITDPSIPLQSFFNYSYLTLPLSVGYKFHLLKRLNIIPQVGSNFLICTNKSEYSIFGDGSQKPGALNLEGIGTNHFQISALVSFEINMNDKWFINIEPFVSKSLLKQYKPYIETRYFTIGGSAGIFRNLY